jgi:predicted HTH transcriptional regulator
MNLGLAPIPPTPNVSKPAKQKTPKANKSRGPRNAGIIAMRLRNLERRENDLISAIDYIRENKQVTVKALGWRFEWSHAKAEDIMSVLYKREKVTKCGPKNQTWWEPVCLG